MSAHVVILGGGYGGLYAAKRLERKLPRDAQITIVSDENFMLFTPLLPGAAAGTLEPRHVVVSLRDQLKRAEVVLGTVEGADPDGRSVAVRTAAGDTRAITYDQLVVALGSTTRTFPVPGLAEHAMGFKTLSEAIALRNRLIHTFEMAEATDDPEARRALLSYVFVGAGYAGLEGIAELQDFARDVIDRYPRLSIDDTHFVLVEARDRVMPEIGPRLADFATRQLRKRGLDVRLGTTLERVEADRVTLAGGEVIPARTVCWTAGVKPVAVVERLGLPIGAGGRIEVDATCRVAGFDDVWAIGDAAGVPDAARPGELCPPTAQHALRQGRLVGVNVARVLAGKEPKPFTFKTLGVFVDMGRYKAVAETGPLRWRGFPAWFLARTYHLMLMPGIKRRVRLVTDWTVGLLFGRDASDLGRLGHPGRLEIPSQTGGDEPVGVAGVALDDRARGQAGP
jgi:NADH:ubiquinone reductase (H+-translocating)